MWSGHETILSHEGRQKVGGVHRKENETFSWSAGGLNVHEVEKTSLDWVKGLVHTPCMMVIQWNVLHWSCDASYHVSLCIVFPPKYRVTNN